MRILAIKLDFKIDRTVGIAVEERDRGVAVTLFAKSVKLGVFAGLDRQRLTGEPLNSALKRFLNCVCIETFGVGNEPVTVEGENKKFVSVRIFVLISQRLVSAV